MVSQVQAFGTALAGKLVFCFPWLSSALPLGLLPQDVLLRATPRGTSRHVFLPGGQEGLVKSQHKLGLAWLELSPLLGAPGEVLRDVPRGSLSC